MVSAAPAPPGSNAPRHRLAPAVWPAAIAVGLAALVTWVYLPVRGFEFVNYDDPSYVADNPIVRAGLTWHGLAWAFTTFLTGNWHPLTWLSHMLDVDLFGVDPGSHHLVNLALHAANSALLFLVLLRATAQRWRSALAAALFAVHPLHVESVAWISERKDLLSALFGLLAILAYVGYARRPSLGRYAAVAALLASSLACKPMLVTLPVALLLLDWWPLRRRAPLTALVREKVPLLLLVAASSAVTFLAQRSGGAVWTLEGLAIPARLANAVLSYGGYLAKAVWPTSLAVVYPHPALTPAGLPAARVALSAAVLVAVSLLVAWQRSARPFLACGWLWYLLTLVPVIGLVQVGPQGMADRYTYLPLVGIFVACVWALPDAVGTPLRRYAVALAALAAVGSAAIAARVQTRYWRDSLTLFSRALAVTQDNQTALRNLGVAYVERGQYERGIAALRASLRLMPGDALAWMDLGIALATVGDNAAAGQAFREAVQLRPDDGDVLFNFGIFSALQGEAGTARAVHARLRTLRPELAEQLASRAGIP